MIWVDADSAIYRYCAQVGQEFTFGKQRVHKAEPALCVHLIQEDKARLEDDFQMPARICLSARRCFRHDLYPAYKWNRRNRVKPHGWEIVRDMLLERGALVLPGLEADDVLGSQAKPWQDVLVSTDKDLLTVPGRHLNPRTDELREVSEEEADEALFLQALTGDSTDNYPGIPGIGPVKAQRIWERDPTWPGFFRAYQNAGLSEQEALLQLRLARILRPGEYQDGKVHLWEPSRATSRPASEKQSAWSAKPPPSSNGASSP